MTRPIARSSRSAAGDTARLLLVGLLVAAATAWLQSRRGEADLERRTARRLRPPGHEPRA